MPFNAAAYYRNKWRADAIAELRRARELKAEMAAEMAAELPSLTRFALGADYLQSRIDSAVRSARCSWRLYLSQCRVAELSRPSWRKPLAFKPAPFSTRIEVKGVEQ